MFDVFVVLATFFGASIGFFRWARKHKGLSTVVSAGGGFLVGTVAFIVAAAIVIPTPAREPQPTVIASSPPPITPGQAKQAAKEARRKQIEKLFSAWDGSHRGLESLIKNAMNDPDSYQHVETVFWDMKDYLVVRTTYRGKNAFGGVVKAWVKAKVSLNGEVLEVIETSE